MACSKCGKQIGGQVGVFGRTMANGKEVCDGCLTVPCYHGPDKKACPECKKMQAQGVFQ